MPESKNPQTRSAGTKRSLPSLPAVHKNEVDKKHPRIIPTKPPTLPDKIVKERVKRSFLNKRVRRLLEENIPLSELIIKICKGDSSDKAYLLSYIIKTIGVEKFQQEFDVLLFTSLVEINKYQIDHKFINILIDNLDITKMDEMFFDFINSQYEENHNIIDELLKSKFIDKISNGDKKADLWLIECMKNLDHETFSKILDNPLVTNLLNNRPEYKEILFTYCLSSVSNGNNFETLKFLSNKFPDVEIYKNNAINFVIFSKKLPDIVEKLPEYDFLKMRRIAMADHIIALNYSSGESRGVPSVFMPSIFSESLSRVEFDQKEKFEHVMRDIIFGEKKIHNINGGDYGFDQVSVKEINFKQDVKTGHCAYFVVYYKAGEPVSISYCDGNLPLDTNGYGEVRYVLDLDKINALKDKGSDILTELDKYNGAMHATSVMNFLGQFTVQDENGIPISEYLKPTQAQKRGNCTVKSTNIVLKSLLGEIYPDEFDFEDPSSYATKVFKEYKAAIRDAYVNDVFELASVTNEKDPNFKEVKDLVKTVFLQSVKKGHADITRESVKYLKQWGVDIAKIQNDRGQNAKDLLVHDFRDPQKHAGKLEIRSIMRQVSSRERRENVKTQARSVRTTPRVKVLSPNATRLGHQVRDVHHSGVLVS